MTCLSNSSTFGWCISTSTCVYTSPWICLRIRIFMITERSIDRFLFRSGNQEHPGDKIENTTVEILPFSVRRSSKCGVGGGFLTIFSNDIAMMFRHS